MTRKHSLSIIGPLHHPKHRTKIAAHSPVESTETFSKFHVFQLRQPRGHMLRLHPQEVPFCRLSGVASDGKVVRPIRVPTLNHAVQAGETQLVNFPTLGLDGILLCSVTEFLGHKVFGMRPNSRLHILSRKMERLALFVHTTQSDVDMGMVCVVVDDCGPFQLCPKIAFQSGHQLLRVSFQVDPVAKFRRDDDLEKAFIPGLLPSIQPSRNVHSVLSSVEPRSVLFSLLGCSLTSQVVSVGFPLAGALVL